MKKKNNTKIQILKSYWTFGSQSKFIDKTKGTKKRLHPQIITKIFINFFATKHQKKIKKNIYQTNPYRSLYFSLLVNTAKEVANHPRYWWLTRTSKTSLKSTSRPPPTCKSHAASVSSCLDQLEASQSIESITKSDNWFLKALKCTTLLNKGFFDAGKSCN